LFVTEGNQMSKTAAIGIRVEPEIKEAVAVAAKMERRSVASYLEKLIVDDLGNKGLMPPEAR
jgi:hypothetical protein